MCLEGDNLVFFDISIEKEEDIDKLLDAIIQLASGEMAQGIYELLMKHPVLSDILTSKILNSELNIAANDDSAPAILPSQVVL